MRQRESTFVSGGTAIAVECFEPAGAGPYPAIVALHGSNGLSNGAPLVRALSLPVVSQGFAVYLPHYFQRTGTVRSDRDTSRANFLPWMQVVADCIGFAGLQPDVDPSRIGIIGISLGAFLGLSVAASDHRVKAIVDFFGGLPDLAARDTKRMAPTLILHGGSDPIVPVEEAYKLKRLLEGLGTPHEMQVYPNEGHVFSPLAALDAGGRTLRFLKRHLTL